ncbi:MFS transporter [Candidatus Methylocalor cossyra]|uniref:MFS transporter, PPP family, 3-phenylpropionic acid transporter n=1 Tax=Candidatus Methylocalor cossyra TaxID=3108543 RepID=A0ABM9NKJ0_9GAMM
MPARLPYLRLSGFYFFYFSALGALLPYWPLYLQAQGFTPAEIGQLMAILAGSRVVAPNLWGWWADRSGRTLRLIRWATFLTLGGFCGVFYAQGFLEVAWVMLAFTFFWNATLPLFETVTLGHLHHDAKRYSRVRLWGSFGFIATVTALGKGLEGLIAIACLPQIILVLFVALWLNTLWVPSSGRERHGDGHGSLGAILKRREVLAFFLASLLLQIGHGPYYVFYSVYLKEHGFTSGETGQLWALGVMAEIVLFAVLHRVFGRYSLGAVFRLSLALTALRWLLIAWGVEHLALLVAAQLLHAVSYGAAHAASVHLVHGYFRGPHHGKGQALYSSIGFGLGGALGSLLSGYLWTAWGPHGLYTAAAGITLLALWVASGGGRRAGLV